MGIMSNAAKAHLLDHVLNNTPWPNVGDGPGLLPSAADGNLFIALHTASPGAGGTQATNEAAYAGGYARQPITRDGTGWAAPAPGTDNSGVVTFAVPTNVVGEVLSHFSIGLEVAGATEYITSAALTAPFLAILGGGAPQFSVHALLAAAIN